MSARLFLPPLQTLQDRLVAFEQSAKFDSEGGRRLRDSLWEELQRVHRALGKESTHVEQVREDLKAANSQIAILKVSGEGGTCYITHTERVIEVEPWRVHRTSSRTSTTLQPCSACELLCSEVRFISLRAVSQHTSETGSISCCSPSNTTKQSLGIIVGYTCRGCEFRRGLLMLCSRCFVCLFAIWVPAREGGFHQR